MPWLDSPELPSRGCFAPPPELLPLPEVWTMTIRFHKKESPFEEETFCSDCTLEYPQDSPPQNCPPRGQS